MSVPVAYATMIVIWSTTPLGITWSNETFSPIAALTLRMCLAAALGVVLLKVFDIRLAWHGDAKRAYAYSLLGVFGAMSLVYFSARYISSGLISVLFALAPVFSSLMAVRLLGERGFSRTRWMAFSLSFVGLIVICLAEMSLGENAEIGILMLLSGVILYSLSGVLVQRVSCEVHPLSMTVGTLVLSIPCFLVAWSILDGELPVLDINSRSLWSVLYLAIFGSLIGFVAYFYVVKNAGAIAVAMVTLATPVFALLVGHTLNGEPLTLQTILGTAAVLSGLVIYYRSGLSPPIETGEGETGL